ncbi:MAG: hypothetical protein JXR88_05535 [Clostridia bacterium]|nr:hypothetical protein [Clostridia bacterium]
MTLLITIMVIVFLLLPISAYLFEKLILEILYQEIEDNIELYAFNVIQNMDLNALSHQMLEIRTSFIDDFNKHLKDLNHPQLKTIALEDFFIKENLMTLKFSIILTPTLYRDVLHIQTSYVFEYGFMIPIDS